MARKSRGIRHTGIGCGLRSLDQWLLFQCRWPASGGGMDHAPGSRLSAMRRVFIAGEKEPLIAAAFGDDAPLEVFWKFGGGRQSLVGERFLGRARRVKRCFAAAFG